MAPSDLFHERVAEVVAVEEIEARGRRLRSEGSSRSLRDVYARNALKEVRSKSVVAEIDEED